jgi:hypothetical protein
MAEHTLEIPYVDRRLRMINTPPQVLAGVLPSARNQVLRGELGGECCSNGERDAAAFVGQDDRFYSHLSVRETLLVAAKLRLPRLGGAESQDVIDELLRQLHLSHVR